MSGTPARSPLTVVVPTRDRTPRLGPALAALRRALGPADELIVVDSASVDAASVATLAATHDARLVRCDPPGAALARNAGWRVATYDAIGFVDDDVMVAPGWADAMVAALHDHPDAAFIAGRVDTPRGSGSMTVAVKADETAHAIDATRRGVLGHSANLVVRREALATVGGFDESLGAGARWRAAEDTDLFDRLLAAGRTGWYEPAAAAEHVQWRRIRQWVVLQHDYGIGSGARLAKLWRTDRSRWSMVARDTLLTWGVAQLPGELWRRDVFRALATVLRLLGVARGFATSIGCPLRDGHFRADSTSS